MHGVSVNAQFQSKETYLFTKTSHFRGKWNAYFPRGPPPPKVEAFQLFGGNTMNIYSLFNKFFTFFYSASPLPIYFLRFSPGAVERGEYMSPSERREKMLEVLCLRRYDTCANLAHEFNVSQRTIQCDIEVLMCSYPIETVRGRYGGGVRAMDGYYHNYKHSGQGCLTSKQLDLLTRLRDQLAGDDLDTINSIIVQFAP